MRIARSTAWVIRGTSFFPTVWAKRWSKGCLFEKHGNRKWHPKTIVYKSSARGPSKNDPRSGFEQIWKNNENAIGTSMSFDGPKPLEINEKQIHFLIFGHSIKLWKKRCQRGPQKTYFGVHNGDMGLPGSTYPLILAFWDDAKKSSFLDALPIDQKIKKIEPWSAKGSNKCLQVFAGAKFLGGGVPQDQLKEGPVDHWTIQKGSRHAVGPKARRIFRAN